MNKNSHSLAPGLLAIICWASLASLGNLVIHLPPFYVLGVSFLTGSLLALRKPKEMFVDLKTTAWGTLGYYGYHFLLFYSFRFAPAIEANLINYLWPMLMVLLTPLFFPKTKLKYYHFFGALLATAGCIVLVFGKGAEFQSNNIKGYLLALGAAFSWPIYSLGKKKMGSSSVWSVGGYCFLTGLLCFLTHFCIEPRVVLQWNDALILMVMGLGPFGFAFYAWDYSLLKGNPQVIGALSYLTPVLSTLGLVLFTDQMMTLPTALAMILIIAGASSGLLDFLLSKDLVK